MTKGKKEKLPAKNFANDAASVLEFSENGNALGTEGFIRDGEDVMDSPILQVEYHQRLEDWWW